MVKVMERAMGKVMGFWVIGATLWTGGIGLVRGRGRGGRVRRVRGGRYCSSLKAS